MPARPVASPSAVDGRLAAPRPRRATAAPARGVTATVRRIVRWYLETVYRRFEGPGTVPFYCDRDRVGPFAVDPVALARGDADALFRLLIVLGMYQSRRDVDIMRRQREMDPRDAAAMASADELGRAIARGRCELLRAPDRFDAGCSVRRDFPSGRATCAFRPRTPCHVKRATAAIGRMGDLGKYPTSAWFHLGRGDGLPGLYDAVCRAHLDPAVRARVLVERVARVYHVGRKLASMFVSAVAAPELAPGLTPWAPAVDGSSLVVVDVNVGRVVDRLAPAGAPKTYAARAAWVAAVAARVRLSDVDAALPARSPRLVQQALYAYRSRANRAARGDPCAATRACDDCVPALCPFRG